MIYHTRDKTKWHSCFVLFPVKLENDNAIAFCQIVEAQWRPFVRTTICTVSGYSFDEPGYVYRLPLA